MPVTELLGRRAWRLWLVVLVTVLAAAGAVLASWGTKAQFQASIDVTVPAALATSSSANGQYVENFRVGLTTDSIATPLAQTTGVSADTLKSGLSAHQLGNSSFFVVEFTSGQASQARTVVTAAAQATATLLAQPALKVATTNLTSAEAALTSAQADAATAQTAVTAFRAANNNQDPSSQFQVQQSLLVQLTVGQQTAAANGRSAADYDAAIATAQQNLAELGPKVAQSTALSNALSTAQGRVSRAQDNVGSARSAVALAKEAPIIGVATSTHISRQSVILKAAVIAGGIGFVASVALMLVSIARSRSRRAPGVPATEVS